MEATDEEKVDETAEDEEREKSDEEKWAEIDEDFDRDEGPFDIEEVDLDQDDVQRIDLGALVVTPFEGKSMRPNSRSSPSWWEMAPQPWKWRCSPVRGARRCWPRSETR